MLYAKLKKKNLSGAERTDAYSFAAYAPHMGTQQVHTCYGCIRKKSSVGKYNLGK